MHGQFTMMGGGPGRESLVRDKSKGSDPSGELQYQPRANVAHLQPAPVDGDDIFWCSDMDPNNKESYRSAVHDPRRQSRPGQASMI